MNATILYRLSESGRKASILSGGNGQMVQTINVENTDPLFPKVVELGNVKQDGSIEWDRQYSYAFDSPQTAQSLIDDLEAKIATEKATKEKELEERKQETLAVITERKTRKHKDSYIIKEDGVQGETTVEYETVDWGYYFDNEIRNSDAAKAFERELHESEVKAKQEAEVRAREDLAVKKAKIDTEKKARLERRKQLGVPEEAVLCKIESGVLTTVPKGCWDSHSRSKNWLAKIQIDATRPGGLERSFAAKAKGDGYYILPSFSPGDSIEFGADYYTGSGRKNPTRWYGYVLKMTETYLCLMESSTGKEACKEGAKYAKEQGKVPVEDAIEAGIARINGEGSIVPTKRIKSKKV